jgi:hypothetical protein
MWALWGIAVLFLTVGSVGEGWAVEQFLDALDGNPPDWSLVYGHGHHDSGLDERLFTLNREQDAKRVAL